MRISRRREAFKKWMANVREGIGAIAGSQVFRGVLSVLLIAGLATSSFYWGMWVERGKPKPSAKPASEAREPVVTERSEDMPKILPVKPANPQPPKDTMKPAPKAAAKPSPSAVPSPVKPIKSVKPVNAADPPVLPAPSATKPKASSLLARPASGDTLTAYEWVYSPTFGDWRFHTGIDIKAEDGAPVKAAAAGTVKSVKDDPAYGTVVTVDHGNGLIATYACVKDVTVAQGEPVAQNQVIGFIGEPGALEVDKGAHLHFEVKRNGLSENPLALLGK